MGKPFRVFLLSTFVVLLLVASLYLFFLWERPQANGEPSVDQILELSVDIPEITTNLLSDDYVRIAFKIQTDSKDGKKELEKRLFQVNNIIIKHLSGLEAAEIEGTEGKINLEENIKTKINAVLHNGKIEQVYITSCIIQ